ncbi:MAG: DUF2007 domain-containing protein [Xanthomonadales bacterium]|nr:DUF2007 domain-containing protein [Xanthomonadales bacterium]
MFKVYENFDISRVGQMQSILETNGIATFLKNEYASGALGEIPFVEICPQLFVLRARDVERAKELLQVDLPAERQASDWVCPECGIDIEGQFENCWKCGTQRDDG